MVTIPLKQYNHGMAAIMRISSLSTVPLDVSEEYIVITATFLNQPGLEAATSPEVFQPC